MKDEMIWAHDTLVAVDSFLQRWEQNSFLAPREFWLDVMRERRQIADALDRLEGGE